MSVDLQSPPEPPFLRLFLRLRADGFALTSEDYRCAIQAFASGFGQGDAETLRVLFRCLWLKTIDTHTTQHFNNIIDDVLGYGVERSAIEIEADTPSKPPDQGKRKKSLPGTPRASKQKPSAAVSSEPISFELSSEGVTLQLYERPGEGELIAPVVDSLVIDDDYFPISRRQIEQAWRSLATAGREGSRSELDLDATIQTTARTGFFRGPVLQPARTVLDQLLLLVDRSASMGPFHDLSDRLVAGARAAHGERVHVAYFANVPRKITLEGQIEQDRLYLRRGLTGATTLDELLLPLRQIYTVAVIISDAGAARGQRNTERADATLAWAERLRSRVRSLAWLNPLPDELWTSTTAELVAARVPMFAAAQPSGLIAALRHLRRPTLRHRRRPSPVSPRPYVP